jgi:hypothetical protein
MNNPIVGGIPLILVVFGLVEFVKLMGVTGKLLTATSLTVGAILGTAYQLSLTMPVNYAGWFAAVIYGLALGLAACGLYDFLNARFPVK